MKKKIFRNLKLKARLKYLKIRSFCLENKEFVSVAVPLIVGSSIKICKYVSKRKNIKKQEDLKERYIYDRSEGHYWELKRPLRTDEWAYVSKERAKGRSYADILLSLKVLKQRMEVTIMFVIKLVLICICLFLVGIFIGMLIMRRLLRFQKLGTMMIESKNSPENMYMVWNLELDDILKYKSGLIQIKTFESRDKQSL